MKKVFLGCLLIMLIAACESARDKADRFFLKGNVSLEEGKHEEAIRYYAEAISKNPKLKEAYNNKGVAYYREGKLDDAIATYTDVLLNVDAYYIDAKRNRLQARIDAGYFDDAARDVLFLEEVHSDSSYIHMMKGIALTKMKRYSLARASFLKAYSKAKWDAKPLVNVANLYYYDKEMADATLYLDSAEALDPNEPSIFNTRSMIESYQGNYEKAWSHSEMAVQMEPGNSYFLNNRGYVYLKLGSLDLAEADIITAIKGDIYNGWAYRNKGMLHNARGEYESAIRNFQMAVKYDSAIELLHTEYGKALHGLGRTEEACAEWDIAFGLFDNDAKNLTEQFCK